MIYTTPIEKPSYRDSFGRFRISSPESIFDAQFTYNAQPLLFGQVTSGGGSINHDTTNRLVNLAFSGASVGDTAYMQSFDFIRYQPGKSQQVCVTFNMKEGVSGCTKYAGYCDGTNGIEFIMNGVTPAVRILSGTTLGNETVSQESWNMDTLDGNGPSKKVLDVSKVQILIIDFQALYSGRVRIGFDIDGAIIYVHEFLHANLSAYPYIQTANLPIRVGMTATGSATTSMSFICSAVISEGGQEENYGFLFSSYGSVTAASGADTHILSIQPKTTFNTFTNRVKVELDSVDIAVTGNNPVRYKVCIGQVLTGTSVADVNTTYSCMETIAGTLSGSPAITFIQGLVGASAQAKGNIRAAAKTRLPVTLDTLGAQRVLGRVTVLVQGIGGTSSVGAVLNWKEIR